MQTANHVDLDGLSLPLVQVGSLEQLSDLVVRARESGNALYPIGGGTMLDLGFAPQRPGQAVDLRKLADVDDYPARDMTITVQAGITVAELRSLLAAEQQRLPVDVPDPAATLGGALATNVSGLRRFGWGTLRDYVIGIGVVNDEGTQIKAGGRVVKNVAGYDLCKLYIGSLGTLGIITRVTLKVVPQPEQHALLALACDVDALDNLLDRVQQSRTRPVAVELLNPLAAGWLAERTHLERHADKWLIVVGYEGNADAVHWQVQQLIKEVKTAYGLEARVGPTAPPWWQALEQLPGRPESHFIFKASLLPNRCAAFCRWLVGLAPEVMVQAHAGNGIVVGHWYGEKNEARASATISQCREWLAAAGALVVLRCPTAWKRSISVWGPARGDLRLMHAIKEKLDPAGWIFNPGRFVDGI